MRSVVAVMKRELLSFFNSPVAYAVIVFFLVFTSAWLFFIQQFFAQDSSSLRAYFGIFPTVFVLLIPAITMRSWAEERKLGTEELLLTFPIREAELVAGKYLAALLLLIAILALTVAVPLTVAPVGFFDPGQIVSEYVGVLFLAAAATAIGLFLSAISANQVTAFLSTVFALLFFTFVGSLSKIVQLPYWLSSVIGYLSIDYHFDSFRKGVLDSRDIAYFVVVSAGFLYANMKVLVLAKWK